MYFVLALSFMAAFLPIILAIRGGFPETVQLIVVLAFNLVAWVIVGISSLNRRHLQSVIEEAMNSFGVPAIKASVADKLHKLLKEMRRWQDASYLFYQKKVTDRNDVGKYLSRIVELAYNDLPCRAVQLILYEKESLNLSQAMMMGTPSEFSSNVQGLGPLDMFSDKSIQRENSSGVRVADEPIYFAGTQFGVLRLELEKGIELTESDLHVLYLLASQAAILLVNARFTDELLRMKKVSDDSAKAKTGFLATLSHEVRGPLGIILNGVELVADELTGPINDLQRETLSMVKKSGDHLLDLINDVLDYAKAEAGRDIPKTVALPIYALLKDMANVIRTQAMRKNHKLIVDPIDPSVGMLCDKRHARQILINFLTNAIKYTPDGGTITLKAQRVRSQRVWIGVTDTGIGILEAERSKVFSPFERVDDAYAKSQVGTGVGMALSQKLTEANKGRIGFESQKGVGSTFWIEMPFVEIDQFKALEASEDTELPMAGKGERVLLVDPELPSRQVVENFLKDQGFALTLAANGREVSQIIKNTHIDLAIVENELEDMQGSDLVRLLRSTQSCSKIPIILVSSHAFSFDIEHFLRMGVDRCLSKPVSLRELALTVRQLIDETLGINT